MLATNRTRTKLRSAIAADSTRTELGSAITAPLKLSIYGLASELGSGLAGPYIALIYS